MHVPPQHYKMRLLFDVRPLSCRCLPTVPAARHATGRETEGQSAISLSTSLSIVHYTSISTLRLTQVHLSAQSLVASRTKLGALS